MTKPKRLMPRTVPSYSPDSKAFLKVVPIIARLSKHLVQNHSPLGTRHNPTQLCAAVATTGRRALRSARRRSARDSLACGVTKVQSGPGGEGAGAGGGRAHRQWKASSQPSQSNVMSGSSGLPHSLHAPSASGSGSCVLGGSVVAFSLSESCSRNAASEKDARRTPGAIRTYSAGTSSAWSLSSTAGRGARRKLGERL